MAKEFEVGYMSKLTISTLGCDPKEAIRTNKSFPLARIYGIANGIKLVEDKRSGNVHVALVGDFEGINLATGTAVRSGICYLPSGIHDQISSPFENDMKLGENRKGVNPIEFGLEISSVPAPNPIGYSYRATAFIKPEGYDPMEKFREAAKSLPPAPAPKQISGKK